LAAPWQQQHKPWQPRQHLRSKSSSSHRSCSGVAQQPGSPAALAPQPQPPQPSHLRSRSSSPLAGAAAQHSSSLGSLGRSSRTCGARAALAEQEHLRSKSSSLRSSSSFRSLRSSLRSSRSTMRRGSNFLVPRFKAIQGDSRLVVCVWPCSSSKPK
jgi:hypothetical protein